MSRKTVNVYSAEGSSGASPAIELPKVFDTPIRADVVRDIFTNISKNSMQPHGNDPKAGIRPSAVSWGPGRAKARVPRVNGSGSNRNGQGAYANFCRGGHRFAPPNLMRRWMRLVPVKQRRFAIATAIAATAVPAFVEARGHIISESKEIPIVVSDSIQQIKKTREIVAVLEKLGLKEDLVKVTKSKVHRSSKGKYRRSAYKTKKGPLVVYHKDEGIVRALRNIPGVDSLPVDALSLIKLAPAGQLGRLVVWTESAFKTLDPLYEGKKGFTLPRAIMTNSDIDRIIYSDEVLNSLRPKLAAVAPCGCRCRVKKILSSPEWEEAYSKVAKLKADNEARKYAPEKIREIFKASVDMQPEPPRVLSTIILDHQDL